MLMILHERATRLWFLFHMEEDMERDGRRSCSWKLLKPQKCCFSATMSVLNDRQR